MDETQSELTRISSLPKRQRLQMDESFQMTSRTLDKSLTEISDVTDLSLSRIQKSSLIHENMNNDEINLMANKRDDVVIAVIISKEDAPVDDAISEGVSVNDYTDDENTPSAQAIIVKTIMPSHSREDTEYTSKTESHEVMRYLKDHVKTEKQEMDITTLKTTIDLVEDVSAVMNTIMEADEISKVGTDLFTAIVDVDENDENDEVLQSDEKNDFTQPQQNDEEINKKSELITKQRHELIQKIQFAIENKKDLEDESESLETKVAGHFRRKRLTAAQKLQQQLQDKEMSVVEKEGKYAKYLFTIVNIQKELEVAVAETKMIGAAKLEEINAIYGSILDSEEEFKNMRHNIALTATNSNTGRKIPPIELESLYSMEKAKDAIVHAVRLENIKLLNRVNCLQLIVVAKESLAKHLNLVDFEQLKLENQAYHGKVEDRNDSIIRLNEKINKNIHMISHTKEKIESTVELLAREKSNLKDATLLFVSARIGLTKVKRSRDVILSLNRRLTQSGGLLNNKKLLHHFTSTVDEMVIQKSRVDVMSRDCVKIAKEERKIGRNMKVIKIT